MAKGQKRGNREAKKPKQPKPAISRASSLAHEPTPISRALSPPAERDRTGRARKSER
jgi:hypothetical protein